MLGVVPLAICITSFPNGLSAAGESGFDARKSRAALAGEFAFGAAFGLAWAMACALAAIGRDISDLHSECVCCSKQSANRLRAEIVGLFLLRRSSARQFFPAYGQFSPPVRNIGRCGLVVVARARDIRKVHPSRRRTVRLASRVSKARFKLFSPQLF